MKLLSVIAMLLGLSAAPAFASVELLNCHLTNIFESSKWTLVSDGATLSATYSSVMGEVIYPDINDALQELGLLNEDTESLKAATILLDSSTLVRNAEDGHILRASSGANATKIIAEVNVNGTIVQREAPLHWANLDIVKIETTMAEGSSVKLEGTLKFYGPGNSYHPNVVRDLDCR